MHTSEEDSSMLNGSIEILQKLYMDARNLRIEDAVKHNTNKKYNRKDMKDTLVIDAMAEDAISLGDGHMGHLALMQKVYGQYGVVITEECGRIPRDRRIEHDTPTIISDPIDQSKYFQHIMTRFPDAGLVGNAFDREMERIGEAKARRQACNSSVTLIKDNDIKYTAVLNLITGDVYVGYSKGVFCGNVERFKCLSDVSQPVTFNEKFDERQGRTMLCYTRDDGKYEENREGTNLKLFRLHEVARSDEGPVGPMRFTYLIKFNDEKDSDVGSVAHNGEKIQESLPNIAMAYFSRGALKAYKMFCDRDHISVRGDRELTPNLANSLYYGGTIHKMGVKSIFLNNYDYPSEFRDTTIIFPSQNEFMDLKNMVKDDYAVRIV